MRIKEFFGLEAASGVVLILAAVLAMLAANSPLAAWYAGLAQSRLTFWTNDGLMALFFLVIGIEIKRELISGELSTRQKALLPLVAAVAGVITPAAIFATLNWGTPMLRGLAIPTATDIAFPLGILALFAGRVSPLLKMFLMAVAVIDDLSAVAIIAAVYTDGINLLALASAAACVLLMLWYNRCRIASLWPYLLLALALWVSMVQSGVHPTLAGVLAGLLLPEALGEKLLHRLHPLVAFAIVPLFAFLNAGIPFGGLTLSQLGGSLPLGIALGLFMGKQIGIFTASWLWLKLHRLPLPGTNRLEFYAVCVLAGIGFTMSLFIGSLAFNDPAELLNVRLGVLSGSLLSALIGSLLLVLASMRREEL